MKLMRNTKDWRGAIYCAACEVLRAFEHSPRLTSHAGLCNPCMRLLSRDEGLRGAPQVLMSTW